MNKRNTSKNTSITLSKSLNAMTLADLITEAITQFTSPGEIFTGQLKLLARYLGLNRLIADPTYRFLMSLTKKYSFFPLEYYENGDIAYGSKDFMEDVPSTQIRFNPEKVALMIIATLASDSIFSSIFAFNSYSQLMNATNGYHIGPLSGFLQDDEVDPEISTFANNKLYVYKDFIDGKTFYSCSFKRSIFMDLGTVVYENLHATKPIVFGKDIFFMKNDNGRYIRLDTEDGSITEINELCKITVNNDRLVRTNSLDGICKVTGLDGMERSFDISNLTFHDVVNDETILCNKALDNTNSFSRPVRVKADGTQNRATPKEEAFAFWCQVCNLGFRKQDGFKDAESLSNRAILRGVVRNTTLSIRNIEEILARSYASESVGKGFYLGMRELLAVLSQDFDREEDISDVFYNILCSISSSYKSGESEEISHSDLRRIVRMIKVPAFKSSILNGAN